MGIPVGTTYTTTVAGRTLKTVRCERCGDTYVYVLTRAGSGRGTSVLWLDNDGAASSAAARAKSELEAALAAGVDPVACPACGWYQDSMVHAARRNRGGCLRGVALIVGATGVMLVALFLWLAEPRAPSPHFVWPVAAIAASVATWVLVRRHAAKWSPNDDAAWKRRAAKDAAGRVMRKEDLDRAQAESVAQARERWDAMR